MAQKMAPSKVASKKAANKKPVARKESHSSASAKTATAKPAIAAQAPKRTSKAPAAAKPQVPKHPAAKTAAASHAKAPARKPAAKEAVKPHSAPHAAKPHAAPKHEPVSKAAPKAMPMPPPAARPAAAATARSMPAAVAKAASQKIIAPAAAPETPAAAQPAAPVATSPAPQPAAASPQQPAAAAAKKDKPVQHKLGFKVNEWIVYPAHGVGRIVAIEEQEIAGIALELFVITFEKDKMTLRVPTGKSASVGMRKLAEEATVKKAIETLKGRARVKRTMWSRRAQEYEAKINSGDLIAIAEVVRDLYRSESQPEQSYSERQLYEAALDRMAREIAVVEKLDERGAVQRITEVLAKSARGRGVAEAA
jgi:CarD family transcriptional regulator